jgi:flagellin
VASATNIANAVTVTDRTNTAANALVNTAGNPATAANGAIGATVTVAIAGDGATLQEGDTLTMAITGSLGTAFEYTVTRDDIGTDNATTLENVRASFIAAFNGSDVNGRQNTESGLITAAASKSDASAIVFTAADTTHGATFAYAFTEADGTDDALAVVAVTTATNEAGTAVGPVEDNNAVATASTKVIRFDTTEIETGDIIELDVAGTTVSYTVTAGDTATTIGEAFETLINDVGSQGESISTDASGIITAASVAGVLTLTSANKGSGSDFTVTANTTNFAGRVQNSAFDLSGTNSFEEGDVIRLSLSDNNFVEVEVTKEMVASGEASARKSVIAALVAQSDDLQGVSLEAVDGLPNRIRVVGDDIGVAFTASISETNRAARAQQDVVTIGGEIGKGDVFTISVGGNAASVTVGDEIASLRSNDDRIAAVRDALLATAKNTNAVASLLSRVESDGANGIKLTALTAGTAITTTATTTNNINFAAQKQIDNVTLSGDAEEGDIFTIDLGNGNAASYTVTADDAAGATAADRLQAARDGLVAASASLAGVVVTAGDDASLVLTAAQAGVGFETAVTTTNAADVAQVETVAFANVEAGDSFNVSIGDESFSYTAQAGDDAASVAAWMQENAAFTGKTLSVVDGALNIQGPAGQSFAVATSTSNFAGGVQVDSLQIAGTVETGDSYAVTINGENISYTVAAADTSISDVRAGLVSAINSSGAAENLTASLNDDGSISLTGLAAGVGFTASASVADVGRSRDTIASIDVSTSDGAVAAMAVIEAAIEQIGATRSELGAISNRLDHTITNLTNVAINTSAAMGRIMDADFAAESTQLAKSQILQQASMAMLAQANASKQGVLSLLQG